MVMYAIILSVVLASGQPQIPVIIFNYSTLNDCRVELVRIGTARGYEFVNSPIVGYGVVKVEDTKTTTAFCVKNIVSI